MNDDGDYPPPQPRSSFSTSWPCQSGNAERPRPPRRRPAHARGPALGPPGALPGWCGAQRARFNSVQPPSVLVIPAARLPRRGLVTRGGGRTHRRAPAAALQPALLRGHAPCSPTRASGAQRASRRRTGQCRAVALTGRRTAKPRAALARPRAARLPPHRCPASSPTRRSRSPIAALGDFRTTRSGLLEAPHGVVYGDVDGALADDRAFGFAGLEVTAWSSELRRRSARRSRPGTRTALRGWPRSWASSDASGAGRPCCH